MVLNPNVGLDASQVEDMRNQTARAAGLADLPEAAEEEPSAENDDEEPEEKA